MDYKTIDYYTIILTDYIINNNNAINNYCFINGKLGMATSIYFACRKLNRKDYEEVANKIVSESFDNIKEFSNNISFEGLSGFGYCIEYLVQNNFLYGNTDESLADIDKIVCKQIINGFTTDISLNNGILGLGMYLIKRIHNKNSNDENLSILTCKAFLKKLASNLNLFIDNLNESVHDYYCKNSNDNINWQYYCFLLFLGKLLESKICYEQTNKMINKSLLNIHNHVTYFTPIQKLLLFYFYFKATGLYFLRI